MSRPTRTNDQPSVPDAVQLGQAQAEPSPPGALRFLLQADPEAIIEVGLVNHPIDLRQDQFEALLFESECEV